MVDLEREVRKALEEYGAEATAVVQEVVPKIAKEAVKKLKQGSPRRTGKYYKGWTKNTDIGRVTGSAVVYGKTGTYQLAHLLEHGHAKRGGGRVSGIEHIKPVEEWVNEEAAKRISDKLESGG